MRRPSLNTPPFNIGEKYGLLQHKTLRTQHWTISSL